MKHLWKWSGTLLLLAGLVSVPARDARCLDHGWYANVGGGVNHLDVESSIRTEPDLGYRLIATGGFQFNRNFALELDTGFIHNTYSQSRIESQRDHALNQVPIVLNGVYSFPNLSQIEPYVGVGGGVMYMSYGDSEGGDATLSFKGGARYLFGERIGVGVDYTFFMLGATSALIGEPVGADTINLTLHWMF